MYALTYLDSICGRVNSIRARELTKILHNNIMYKKKLIDLVGDTQNWETDFFYFNLFQRIGNANFDTNSATLESIKAIRNDEDCVSIN